MQYPSSLRFKFQSNGYAKIRLITSRVLVIATIQGRGGWVVAMTRTQRNKSMRKCQTVSCQVLISQDLQRNVATVS